MIENNNDYNQEIGWLLKEKYQGVMSDAAQADIDRIKQGEPVAYVIGFVDFLGCRIDLSEKPLIPRPETEFWVEKAIANIKDVKHPVLDKVRCLDIFAGSGCIGVAILKNIPSATVDFVDSESNAIKQIGINCQINNLDTARYKIIHSNILENVGMSYDYIFANPPYVAEAKKSAVQKSVLDHEPHKALFSGAEGLNIIKQFLGQAKKHLNADGRLYMEFDDHQKDAIENILKEAGFSQYDFYQDQFKKWRYLCTQP